MFSWEIDRLIKIKQDVITCSEYLEILSTSPQINHIKYDAYEDKVEINTNDDYSFKVKIKSPNIKN